MESKVIDYMINKIPNDAYDQVCIMLDTTLNSRLTPALKKDILEVSFALASGDLTQEDIQYYDHTPINVYDTYIQDPFVSYDKASQEMLDNLLSSSTENPNEICCICSDDLTQSDYGTIV